MFKGSFVALVTPHKNGKVDEKKFRELIKFHIDNGTDGIVPCGCTGEAATLSHEEQKRLVDITVETVNGKVPIIAGAGSNYTEEAVGLTKHAKKAGCDGALSITPYQFAGLMGALGKRIEGTKGSEHYGGIGINLIFEITRIGNLWNYRLRSVFRYILEEERIIGNSTRQ